MQPSNFNNNNNNNFTSHNDIYDENNNNNNRSSLSNRFNSDNNNNNCNNNYYNDNNLKKRKSEYEINDFSDLANNNNCAASKDQKLFYQQIRSNLMKILNLSSSEEQRTDKFDSSKQSHENIQEIHEIAKQTLHLVNEKIEKGFDSEPAENNPMLTFQKNKLIKAISENNQKEVSDLLIPLFKNPSELKMFLESLKERDKLVFLTLLKSAFNQENIAIFHQILNYIIAFQPEMFSENQFQNILIQVFNRPEWSDTRLQVACEDRIVEIFFIRSLFAAKSKYFAALLNGSFKEGQKNELSLDWKQNQISSKTAFSIFRFLYNEKIHITSETAQSCMVHAKSLDIPSLEKECNDWISNFKNWDEETIKNIYALGDMHDNNTWKQVALSNGISYILFHPNSSLNAFLNEHAKEVQEWHLKENLNFYGKTGDGFEEKIAALYARFPNLKKFTCDILLEENFLDLVQSRLQRLEHLRLVIKNFSKLTPWKQIYESKTLKKLELKIKISDSKIKKLFEKFNSMSHLVSFSIQNNYSIKRDQLPSFNNFSDLEDLQLLTNATKDDLENLEKNKLPVNNKIKNLTFPYHLLSEDHSQIKGSSIKDLNVPFDELLLEQLSSSFPELESIVLKGETLTMAQTAYLAKHPNLKRLHLSFEQMPLNTAENLAQIPFIEELDLQSKHSDFAWIKHWIEELEKRGKLDQISSLKFNIQLSQTNIKEISAILKLKNLRKLAIETDANSHISFDVKSLFSFSQLEELTCNKLAKSLNEFHTHFPYIKKFVSNAYYFKDEAWNIKSDTNEDLSFAKEIRELDIRITPNFQNPEEFIEKLSPQINDLQTLTFSGPLSNLLSILAKTPNLKKLVLVQQFCHTNPNFAKDTNFIQVVSQLDLEILQILLGNGFVVNDDTILLWPQKLKDIVRFKKF